MRFNVTLVDPPHYKFAHLLTDLCRTIAYGLRDLGYKADLTVNSIDGASTNILIGTHLLTADDVSNIVRSGAPFITLQSEVLKRDPTTGAVRSDYQGEQFETINRPLMDHAMAVWDGITPPELMQQLDVGGRKRKRFRIGYCAGLEDIDQPDYAQKDIDVMFFGSITQHRSTIMSSLNGLQYKTFDYGPAGFRNDLIARSKINLSLHSSPELDYFQQTRSGYLLNNRAFVLGETSSDHPPMKDLICEVDGARMRDTCVDLLSRPAELKARAEAAYEGYRSLRMADILAEIIEP
jgi:hypothetical protein